MAEGGEPLIHEVSENVVIESSVQRRIGLRLSAVYRHRRAAQIEEAIASGSSGAPNEEAQLVYSTRIPPNMLIDPTRQTPDVVRHLTEMARVSHGAEQLISNLDYKGAVTLLEDPCILNSQYFPLKLMLAECYLYLGMDVKGKKIIKGINKSIVVSLGPNPDDVLKHAEDYLQNLKYIRAVIVLRKASRMYKTCASTPDESLNGINSCSEKTAFATERMFIAGGTPRSLVVGYGIKFAKRILRHLKSVKHADLNNKATAGAWSCTYIASNLQLVQKYKKSKKYLKRGVKFLAKQFGRSKSEYQVYCHLMLYLGTAYDNLGYYYPKGEKCYRQSLIAKENVKDYDSESQKEQDIRAVKELIQRRKSFHESSSSENKSSSSSRRY